MMTKIFDGKKAAQRHFQGLAAEITELKKRYGFSPKLAVVLIGNDPASEIYIRMKERACRMIGIVSQLYKLTDKIKESALLALLNKLNKDRRIHGILVQFPLAKHLSKERIMAAISPLKDVDGFNPLNLGRLLLGDENLAPCTPKAVIKILEDAKIDIKRKDVVIINHSNTVGKPLSLMLLAREATVDVCHRSTKELSEHTNKADIVITATGVPGLIKKAIIKKGAVLIDVGISRLGHKVYGDVDFESVRDVASFLTPVPGGVGPLTVAMLMENTVKCYKNFLNV